MKQDELSPFGTPHSSAQDELERTRKEYETLEQHFLEMEKNSSDDEEQTQGSETTEAYQHETIEDPAILEPLDVAAELEAAAKAEQEESSNDDKKESE